MRNSIRGGPVYASGSAKRLSTLGSKKSTSKANMKESGAGAAGGKGEKGRSGDTAIDSLSLVNAIAEVPAAPVIDYPLVVSESALALQNIIRKSHDHLHKPAYAIASSKDVDVGALYTSINAISDLVEDVIRDRARLEERTKMAEFQHNVAAGNNVRLD